MFRAKSVDTSLIDDWEDVLTPLTSDLHIPNKDTFLTAIAASRHSSVGLDGVPYGAYARSSEIAEIFADVAAFMATPASIPPYDFNHSILCVLPQKPPHNSPNLEMFTNPRPLDPSASLTPRTAFLLLASDLLLDPLSTTGSLKIKEDSSRVDP